MPGTIRVGCKVSSLIGPKLPLTGTQKRRSRQRYFGTVIKSCENQKWTVYWNEIDRCADHPFNSLRFESSRGTSLDGIDLHSILASKHLGLGDPKVIESFLATWQPPLPLEQAVQAVPLTQPSVEETNTDQGSTATRHTIGLQPITMQQPEPSQDSNPINLNSILTDTSTNSLRNSPNSSPNPDPTPNNNTEEPNQEPNEETHENTEPEQEEVFDPDSIVRDIVEDDSSGRNLRLRQIYEQEKAILIGSEVNTAAGLTWKVRNDIRQSEVADEYDPLIGIRNFDFNNKRMRTNTKGLLRINFLDLLIHLWPGDWKSQLTNLNKRIHDEYKQKVKMTRHGRVKKVHEVTEREFWIFWGIIIVARLEGRKGGRLWDRLDPEGYGSKVDLSAHMKQHRFVDIKRFIPFLFANESKKETDPWWRFSSAVSMYNNNRKHTIKPSLLKVFDESMSAFRPRTSRFGNLPHLSCIDRKPEPLGTEFKVANSSAIGIGLYLEIQRGRVAMSTAEFVPDMKKTAACCCRMTKGTVSSTHNEQRNGNVDTYLGDSWFASVDTVVEMKKRFNSNFIGVVKTSHSRYPKKWLEATMKDWPLGSHIVLEAVHDGVVVQACGYKYNKCKVCCFVFTQGAGHTEPGRCYEAKWKDDNGNTMTRDVAHPQVISKYFSNSNVIDVFNQARQFDLRLEKHWVTEDGYFRLITTLFGIVITDCWKGYSYHLPTNHRHKGLEIKEFARLLTRDLLENLYPNDRASKETALTIMDRPNHNHGTQIPSTINALTPEEADACTMLSSLSKSVSQTSSKTKFTNQHPLGVCSDETYHEVKCPVSGKVRSGKRKRRGKCTECGTNTRYYCVACKPGPGRHHHWCCPDTTGSNKKICHTLHKKKHKKED